MRKLKFFPSMWLIKNWSDKQQIIFTHKQKLNKNVSMEILMKKFKAIALKNNQFGNRQNNNIDWTFLHVQLINIPI